MNLNNLSKRMFLKNKIQQKQETNTQDEIESYMQEKFGEEESQKFFFKLLFCIKKLREKTENEFNNYHLNFQEIDNIQNNSKYKRALSLNLVKYQEMEKILNDINKQKNKLGESVQKLLNLHKNEISINNILIKENHNFKEKCKRNFNFKLK